MLRSLPTKAADGFLLHPAVSQAALMDCSELHGRARVSMPIAGSCLLLPIRASKAAAATWNEACKAAALSGPNSFDLVAIFSGLQHSPAEELQPFHPIVEPLSSVSELLYHTEWQAYSSLTTANSSAMAHPGFKLCSSSFQQNVLPEPHNRLANAAISAGAGVLRALQTWEQSLQHFCLQTVGLCPAQTPGPGGLAIEAAAMAGIMRSVPLEMPRLGVQLQDSDPTTTCDPGRCTYATVITAHAGGPSAGGAHTDVHGMAARGGAVHQPRLQYSTLLPGIGAYCGMPVIGGQSCFVVTGGLGGLGMMASSWLANSGVQSLVLVSRTGIAAAATSILTTTALVEMSKADVAFLADAKLVASAAQSQQSRHVGTLHAAGVQASCWQRRNTVHRTN